MLMPLRRTLCSLLMILITVCLQAQTPDYLNTDLSTKERVEDLVNRMTLEEKVSQMLDQAPAIERLNIPQYNWWNEALHGVARAGLATTFPQAIGLAATWDEELIFEMATAISDEARAKHHEYVRKDKRLRYQGLTMWSPNINIFRDPRWGRGQETYGEDPFLTGRLAVNFIQGLQGHHPEYYKTVSTVKHFAVHSGPEPERHTFDAVVNERDFRETYLPMFKTGILEGEAYSLMCAYNRVNGEAACASDTLLQDILRDEWNFDGYVVSDCWALNDIYENHKLVETSTEAAAMALKSGTDLDCGTEVYPKLLDAVEEGYITEDEIDASVKRLFTARFKLGMFDPPELVDYQNIPYSVVDSDEHKKLAEQVARESMVLLKNDGTLPLQKGLDEIAVIGPNSDQWLMLLGNYNGVPSETTTPLEGIREAVSEETKVTYARGTVLAEDFPFFEVMPGNVLSTPAGEPGLQAEYYGERELETKPLYDETIPNLDANWTDGAPREDMDDDNFGVRWTGVITPKETGMYELGTISTMRFELYLDDSLAIRSRYNYRDEFGDPRVIATDALHLEAGKEYHLRIDGHESYADAQMQLVWNRPVAQEELQAEALKNAKKADAVVMFMGLSPRLEGEEMDVDIDGFRGGDRTKLSLPKPQQELIQNITKLGKPTVLVLLNGSALALNWEDENVPAILEAWYPGQAAGTAIADVLFGEYNPAGRLPLTFYKSTNDLPPFDDYNMDGRTYRYFDGDVLYPFGHGLSYTEFGYSNLQAGSKTISEGDSLSVSVDIANTGEVAGDEVVQLYVRYPESEVERPLKDLRGFDRIHIEPGETQIVTFSLKADDLRYWNPARNEWILEQTPVELMIGASSEDIRKQIIVEIK